MKNVILTIAIVLVCAVLIVGQTDVTMLEREGYKAKNLADEMAAGASLCIDLKKYSEGYIVYDYEKGCEIARDILKASGRYDDAYNSLGGYFKENAVVDIYFFDQTENCKHYTNEIKKTSDSFSFHFSDRKKLSEYVAGASDEYIVEYPFVYVIYHAGKAGIRANFISSLATVTKQSIYEYKC